jgi:hypothetical protein
MKKGKVLVKSPSAMTSLANAYGGQALQDLFRVKTKPGKIVGGALGGLSALTSLADASENQQDAFSAAQTAAGRGVGTYLGAGKTIDSGVEAREQHKEKKKLERANRMGMEAFNAQMPPGGNVAPPQHYDTQVAVRRERAAQPAASPDFNIPENFQLGIYGTPMPGGNQVVSGQKGIQRNMFNPAAPAAPTGLGAAGLGNVDPSMLQNVAPNPDVRAGQSYADQVYQTPTGSAGVPTMTMEQMGQMLPGVEQTPLQTQNAKVGSSQIGVPAKAAVDPNQVPPEDLVAEMDAQGAAGYFGYQNNMKNAGEPMELAFMLLKSVMR